MEKSTKKKIIIGLGAAATGVLGFFGWQWWKDNKGSSGKGQNNNNLPDTNYPSGNNNTGRSLPSGNSDLPLKKGSKGARVKTFQQALIAKYGASILPRYGADGDFGNEVAAALQKEGLPATIDEATYNSIVGGSGNTSGAPTSSGIDAGKAASDINEGISNTDLTRTLAALREMNSVADYSAVNKVFEDNYTFGFVKKTIVNAVLDAFTDETQKVQIRLEFTRMGLKYDGTKWSLSGIEAFPIITTSDTEIISKEGDTTQVTRGTVLGKAVGQKGEWMYFIPANAQVILKVKKENIRPFKPKQ